MELTEKTVTNFVHYMKINVMGANKLGRFGILQTPMTATKRLLKKFLYYALPLTK